MTAPEVVVRPAGPDDADAVLTVIRESFCARPALDPPAGALAETPDSVRAALAEHGGLLAFLDARPVGSLLYDGSGPALKLRRVGVLPQVQGYGVAGALVHDAIEHARYTGFEGVRVVARVELPQSRRFWMHHGFVPAGREGVNEHLVRQFGLHTSLPTAASARALGARLASVLRAGDLVILSGDLGAGKTTLTQGLGAGLQVRGDITSPTFVIARVHPSLVGGPPLVHVDAYRLGGIEELDDLDLDTSLDSAVTVVEWGSGVAEGLADERLELTILRATGDSVTDDEDPREVLVHPIGLRWLGAGLRDVVGPVVEAAR